MPIARFDQIGTFFGLDHLTRSEVSRIIRKYIWLVLKKWLQNGLILIRSLKASSNFLKKVNKSL